MVNVARQLTALSGSRGCFDSSGFQRDRSIDRVSDTRHSPNRLRTVLISATNVNDQLYAKGRRRSVRVWGGLTERVRSSVNFGEARSRKAYMLKFDRFHLRGKGDKPHVSICGMSTKAATRLNLPASNRAKTCQRSRSSSSAVVSIPKTQRGVFELHYLSKFVLLRFGETSRGLGHTNTAHSTANARFVEQLTCRLQTNRASSATEPAKHTQTDKSNDVSNALDRSFLMQCVKDRRLRQTIFTYFRHLPSSSSSRVVFVGGLRRNLGTRCARSLLNSF